MESPSIPFFQSDTFRDHFTSNILNNGNNGLGSDGIGFTDELPKRDFDCIHVRYINQ